MQALTGAATITVDAAQAATVAAAVLPDIGPGLAGLQVTATAIKGVAQDNGQGRPPDNWDLTASPAGAVLLYFDGRSGRIASVVALADVALAAAGLAPVTTATSQGQIAVRGEIVAAYDAGAPAQNHVRGRAAQVLLDRRTGRILHVQ